MKRILATLLALTTGCTMLASCGSDSSSDANDEKEHQVQICEQIDKENALFENLCDSLNKGIATITIIDMRGDETTTQYVTSDGKAAYIKVTDSDGDFDAFMNESGCYYFDHAGKRYFFIEDEDVPQSARIDTVEIAQSFMQLGGEYAGTYEVKIDGEKFIAERYNNGKEIFYHVFDGDWMLINTIEDRGGKMVLAVDPDYCKISFGTTVDEYNLQLPEGYSPMSKGEYSIYTYEKDKASD